MLLWGLARALLLPWVRQKAVSGSKTLTNEGGGQAGQQPAVRRPPRPRPPAAGRQGVAPGGQRGRRRVALRYALLHPRAPGLPRPARRGVQPGGRCGVRCFSLPEAVVLVLLFNAIMSINGARLHVHSPQSEHQDAECLHQTSDAHAGHSNATAVISRLERSPASR